ncbi:unnamed protein product [Ambrosiozyma monospora]|uniref:Unnamed protein product n=1 Tax=Ambrosiozyma monospora TaxID=43982 RepID=A0A9W6YYL8_AMBMO|nr:unnamed protein product [Ambrosiozyma monospora]
MEVTHFPEKDKEGNQAFAIAASWPLIRRFDDWTDIECTVARSRSNCPGPGPDSSLRANRVPEFQSSRVPDAEFQTDATKLYRPIILNKYFPA